MTKKIIFTTVIIVVIVTAAGWLLSRDPQVSPIKQVPTQTKVINPADLPGIQTGDYPWPPELDNLRERLGIIGLPVLLEEGHVLHTHQHLDMFILGDKVNVPRNIGINSAQNFISQIHVHDDTNIIHVESPVVQEFTLGNFFDVWGVRFTNDCLGGYCNSEDKLLKVFVGGLPYTGDFRQLKLESGQEIVVFYGTPAQFPSPIPDKFDFPPDY